MKTEHKEAEDEQECQEEWEHDDRGEWRSVAVDAGGEEVEMRRGAG
jgi:hypothetical protein